MLMCVCVCACFVRMGATQWCPLDSSKNVLIISAKLVYVPIINPATPTSTMILFSTSMRAFRKPLAYFQCVNSSISAGNANPRADRHSAPNSEMNSSRLGMATASRTVDGRNTPAINTNRPAGPLSPAAIALTRDQHQARSHGILPEYFARAAANALHHVIGPCDVDRHIARQAMCDEDRKRQHTLHTLRQTTFANKNQPNQKPISRCQQRLAANKFQITYISSAGRFSVIEPWMASPYLMNPNRPIPTYSSTITTMPWFSTPNEPPNAFGVFISFSSGNICTKHRRDNVNILTWARIHHTYHTDRLQGEQHGAKVEGKVLQFAHRLPIFQRQRLAKEVVADDAERYHRNDVGQCGERCQVFQITDLYIGFWCGGVVRGVCECV